MVSGGGDGGGGGLSLTWLWWVVVVVVVVIGDSEEGLRVVGWGCVSLFCTHATGITYFPNYIHQLCLVNSAGYCIVI